jgi:hypothetical protein
VEQLKAKLKKIGAPQARSDAIDEVGADVHEFCKKALKVYPKMNELLCQMRLALGFFQKLRSESCKPKPNEERLRKLSQQVVDALEKTYMTEELSRRLDDLNSWGQRIRMACQKESQALEVFQEEQRRAATKAKARAEAKERLWGSLKWVGIMAATTGALLAVTCVVVAAAPVTVTCGVAAAATKTSILVGGALLSGAMSAVCATKGIRYCDEAVRHFQRLSAEADERLGDVETTVKSTQSAFKEVDKLIQMYKGISDDMESVDVKARALVGMLSFFDTEGKVLQMAVADQADMDFVELMREVATRFTSEKLLEWEQHIEEVRRENEQLFKISLATADKFIGSAHDENLEDMRKENERLFKTQLIQVAADKLDGAAQ